MSNWVTGLRDFEQNMRAVVTAEQRALHDAMDEIGHLLANYAKQNHSWKPRTGITDKSTVGEIVEETAEHIVVSLHTGTSYSVFLELAHNGKYAWLWKAVIANAENIKAVLARHGLPQNLLNARIQAAAEITARMQQTLEATGGSGEGVEL